MIIGTRPNHLFLPNVCDEDRLAFEPYPGLLCVVRQVKARYFHLFDVQTLAPQRAEVEVVLEEYVEASVNYGEVRQ